MDFLTSQQPWFHNTSNPVRRSISELSKSFKFYLSFENSRCKDYITEKLFSNAFQNNLIPIVAGAPKIDYLKMVPEDSFIHVDDFSSVKKLADFINKIESSENDYQSYFSWRMRKNSDLFLSDTSSVMKNYGWCKLCRDLKNKKQVNENLNLQKWWYGYDSFKNKNSSVCH